MYCSKCGAEINDQAVVCIHCGCAVNNASLKQESKDDSVSVGFCILSALIPLFGIIFWAVASKETPKKAKACGITALISFAVSIVLSILLSVIFSIVFAELFTTIIEAAL